MADEGQSNEKFNETRSKSVIIRSPDGKSITKHTSIHITRVNNNPHHNNNGPGVIANENQPSYRSADQVNQNPPRPSSQPMGVDSRASSTTGAGGLYYRCKSTSPNRSSTLYSSTSTLPRGQHRQSTVHGISSSSGSPVSSTLIVNHPGSSSSPGIRRTTSSLQISVNITSPSSNDLIMRQSRSPLPVRRSQTTFESSWILSSSSSPISSVSLQSPPSSGTCSTPQTLSTSPQVTFSSRLDEAPTKINNLESTPSRTKNSGSPTVHHQPAPAKSTAASQSITTTTTADVITASRNELSESTIKPREGPKQTGKTTTKPATSTTTTTTTLTNKSQSRSTSAAAATAAASNGSSSTSTTPSPSPSSPTSQQIKSQVAIDIKCGRRTEPSPSRISITRETISSRTIKPKDITIYDTSKPLGEKHVTIDKSRSSSPTKGSILRSPTFSGRLSSSREKSMERISGEELITKESTNEAEVYEKTLILPLDGWTVSDAIQKGYLNTEDGTFTVPGSDHQIILSDCCRLKIINPSSAEVVDPSRPFTRPMNLSLAFERGLMDSNGAYLGNEREPRLSLAQALDRKYVTLNDRISTSNLMARKVIKITKSMSNQMVVTLEPESMAKARNDFFGVKTTEPIVETRQTTFRSNVNTNEESGEEENNITEIAFIDDDETLEQELEEVQHDLDEEIHSSECDGRTTIETIRADDLMTTETISADLILKETASQVSSDSGDENWTEIVDEISQRLDIIKENEKFQANYSSLSNWLGTVESRLNELGPIGNDLKLIATQRNKLSTLRGEFKQHLSTRATFISSGKLLSTRMDPHCAEYQQVARLTEKLLTQWTNCETLLSEKERNVKSLDSFIESFGGKLTSLENDIDSLTSDLDDLKMSDARVNEKCQRLETLNEQLTLSRSTLAECEVITDHLYQLVDSQVKADEVRGKFNSIERKSVELSNEIETVNRYLTKLRDFESCEASLNDWLTQVSVKLEVDLRVSTDETELKNELASMEKLRSEFDRRESKLRSLESMGTGLLDAASSLATGASAVKEISRVSGRVESVQLTWNELSKEIDSRVGRLESALKSFVSIKSNLVTISNWLDELEVELSNVADLTYDQGSLGVQLKAIEAIAFEMNGKASEYEKINQITLDTFNVGVKESRDEINGLIERWKTIAGDTEEKRARLKGLLDSLKSLDSLVDEIQGDFDSVSSKIDSSGLMESPNFESRSIDRLKGLLETVKTLERKVERARNTGLELAKQFEQVESTSSKESQAKVEPLQRIGNLSNRVSTLRLSLETRYSLLLQTKQSVDKIQRKMDSVERSLIRLTESSHKLPTIVTRDSVTLTKQREETIELVGEVKNFINDIKDLGSTIEDEKSYLSTFEVTHKTFLSTLSSIDSRRSNLLTNLNDRLSKIETSLKEAQDVEEILREMADWLKTIETIIDSMEDPSYLVETIERQLKETGEAQSSINSKRETLNDLERRGPRREKEMLISLRSRYNKLTSRVTKRACALERNLKQGQEFMEKWNGLINWLTGVDSMVTKLESSIDCPSLVNVIAALREMNRDFDHKQGHLDSVCRMGRNLKEKSPKSDADSFRSLIDSLRSQWATGAKSVHDLLRRAEKTYNALERYRKLVKQLKDWLSEAVISFDRLHGDPETVQRLIKEHNNFTKQLALKNDSMAVLRELVDELVNLFSADCTDSESILGEYESLLAAWDELNMASQEKEIRLNEALEAAEKLKSSANKMMTWLIEIETSMGKYKSTLGSDEVTLRMYIDEINGYIEKMGSTVADRDEILSDAQQVLTDCHPDAIYAIRHYVELIESTWDDVARALVKRESELQGQLDEMIKRSAYMAELSGWLTARETEFDILDGKAIPNEIEPIQVLLDEMEGYRVTLHAKETDLDKLAEDNRKESTGKRRRIGFESTSSNSKMATEIPLDAIVDPKVVDILTRWRSVTSRTRDRLIRLRSKLNFYLELEKLRDFDFDSWRRRFIDWLDNRSARLMDFYRKLDDNRDNKITYEEFIDGFVRHKFPATRGELQRVAAIFDRNNDGFIDAKEWMEKLKDPSEIEMIVTEMRKQSAKCTCLSKYRVHQVEDKKYQFGESHKLRLVRILRSDIMVRVGGGWVSLTEFLLKNDPCRAKGRTNVELREPLADGVSQSMASFQSRSPYFGANSSFLGPITNIRERTERSLPMSINVDRNEDDDAMDDDSICGAEVTPTSSRPQSRLTFTAKDERCPSRSSNSQEKRLRIDTRPRWH